MLGFVVGSVCLLGLIRLARHGRSCGHHRHQRHGCCGGRGGRGREDGHRRDDEGDFGDGDGDVGGSGTVFLRGLFARLQTSPGQERALVEALKELKAAYAQAKAAQRKSARDLGDALRGETLSVEAMGSVFASLDEGAEAVRTGAFSALTKIHEVLDERQRRLLSDLIARHGGLQDLADAV